MHNPVLLRLRLLGVALLLGLLQSPLAHSEDAQTTAKHILDATGVTGGLVVHLGCGDGEVTASLGTRESLYVHGLDRDANNVEQARQTIRKAGLYGRVSADRLQGNRLPYIDNLVNLVVAEHLGEVSEKEVLRVLVPDGTAYLKKSGVWTKLVKPRSKKIDDWTHYLHDSTGNAVAHDEEVGPPRHMQWVGSPRWSRHHDRMASMSALVSSQGRLFYIMDEGSRVSIQLPPKWTVIARDAFNGVVLWKKAIPTWHNHLWPLKSGPTQLTRRLVAIDGKVYVTLGFDQPVTQLDAATGETIRVFEPTKATEEMIVNDGVLFALVNKGEMELNKFRPQLNLGDQRRVSIEHLWNRKPRIVMALDTKTGKLLWQKETLVAPLTLSADAKRVFFHDGEKVVGLDRATGKQLWASKAGTRPRITFNFGPKLVLYKDVVLCAGGDRKMVAFDAESGRELWSAPHPTSGYQSPEDLLVAGGLVWAAPTTKTKDTGVFMGRDPKTGKVVKQFPPDVKTYWFHHRCYIAKATDNFLLTSRTGIEFVDMDENNWDIHHWVRGGCLYGIMPCNGLVYAPPHDCACYPEAKLFGFNALAPSSTNRREFSKPIEEGRLEKGSAYNEKIDVPKASADDWPTFRHDAARSSYTKAEVPENLVEGWQTKLGGRLSQPVVAAGTLYVAQIDEHLLHALDAKTGKSLWTYRTGGRLDSPPTLYKGSVLIGSADGHVYCLRAADGALIWRFRAAPRDLRLMAFEQLESVWPVHGTILVKNDSAYFVAGRSNFLDGGLHFFRLDPMTGKKLVETVIDDKDPNTKKNLQERLQTLQMPVGLPDILSSKGEHIFMRSQRFDANGKRLEIGPHSGQANVQGATQKGEGIHLFSPTGYLDGSWFHRSYWVYGKSFAGGHNGYYQAGKFAPAGRLLAVDDEKVYGFGRKPQYLRWTTTIEHQLFAAPKEPPEVPTTALRPSTAGGTMVRVPRTKSLNPAKKALVVEAWANSERAGGVILAHGGPLNGYALTIKNGQPQFQVRAAENVHLVQGKQKITDKWTHLVGVLTEDKKLQLYVDGKLVATGKGDLIGAEPKQAMEIGADAGGSVGEYRTPNGFTGLIDDVRVYHGSITAEEVQAHFADPTKTDAKGAKLAFSCTFDKGTKDESGNNNHGTVQGAKLVKGQRGKAARFSRRQAQGAGSLVSHDWTQDKPLYVQAMALANKTLFLAGPPDLIDEEKTFAGLTKNDEKTIAQLAEQDAALQGEKGSLLLVVSTQTGKTLAQYKFANLPVWDGMALANGSVFVVTQDGTIVCWQGKE